MSTQSSEQTEAPAVTGTLGRDRGGNNEKVDKLVGRVDSLVCFEVTEDELAQLEQGSPDSVLLNLAITFLTLGVTLLTTFFSARFEPDFAKYVFTVVTVVALIAGVTLLVVYLFFRRMRTSMFKRIRQRGAPK